MEEIFQDQKEKAKDIANLSREIQALKITLIGIDGKDGLRGQMKTLSEDINEIKKVLNKNFTALSTLQNQEGNFFRLFASKEDLKESESKLYDKINLLSEKVETGVEKRQKERDEQEKYLRGLKNSRVMMIISIIALCISIVTNFIL